MKRYGALVALGLAVAFGLVAVFLTRQWLATQISDEKVVTVESAPTEKVVIAARDIGIGSRLSPENLTIVDWPKANVPIGSFHDFTELDTRVAVSKVVAGSPIIKAELAPPGSGAGLVALIEPGMRAMAIRVDEVTGVGGFILPNTIVDVIGVEEKQGGEKTVQTILKKIQVLAIAQDTYTEEGQAKIVRTVTLAIEPKQAETLALQTHKGTIHLVLRNPMEGEPEPEKVVETKKPVTIIKRVVTKKVVQPEPQPYMVEVIRGTERNTVKFRNAQSEERY